MPSSQPVRLTQSTKTTLADCLVSLVARTVMKKTRNPATEAIKRTVSMKGIFLGRKMVIRVQAPTNAT